MSTVQIQKEQKAELHTKLWEMANELRGNMEAYEFKNYILGLIFYRYLSERVENFVNMMNEKAKELFPFDVQAGILTTGAAATFHPYKFTISLIKKLYASFRLLPIIIPIFDCYLCKKK